MIKKGDVFTIKDRFGEKALLRIERVHPDLTYKISLDGKLIRRYIHQDYVAKIIEKHTWGQKEGLK